MKPTMMIAIATRPVTAAMTVFLVISEPPSTINVISTG
jgi:hypothetical protein